MCTQRCINACPHRHGEDDILVAGQIGDVPVQRHTLVGRSSLGRGHGHAEDGVGTKFALVLGAIQLQQEGIQLALVHGVDGFGHKRRRNHLVDVLDSRLHALAEPLALVLRRWR
jgi:hypothetical protein